MASFNQFLVAHIVVLIFGLILVLSSGSRIMDYNDGDCLWMHPCQNDKNCDSQCSNIGGICVPDPYSSQQPQVNICCCFK
ncbi:hypothetical protein MKW94_019606 [Papaver nudicaule]|uniref:Uncharacterized protein n=1 Tax=Papaver nudicaule TaxID=74823 RepID=A0AA41RRT3_PAPNU|nr:hypothetical protein [Papaver nudicaule]